MNERKIGIILSYINIILQTIINFLYVPLLLYYMGQSEYGLYQLMGSIIAYFGIMDFGLTSATIRTYIKYKVEKKYKQVENFLAMTQRIYICICIFAVITGGILYNFLDEIFSNSLTTSELISAKYIFILLLLNIVITFLGMVYRSVITANEKFLFMKGIETIQLILQPFAVLLVMQAMPTAFAMVCVITIMNLILTGIRIYYCYDKINMKMKYSYWDKSAFDEMKILAASVFIVTIVDQIFWRTNQIILGIISGTAVVAIYSIASLVYMNYMALSTTISGVYLPKISKLVAENVPDSVLSNEFLKVGRIQYYLLALVSSGFIVFGKEFIILWTNSNFIEAYYIAIIIIIPFTVNLIQNIGNCIMQAKNVYNFRAFVYLGVGIFNLILAIPAAKYYGGIGAASVSGIALFVSNGLIMNWYFKKYLNIDIKTFWKQILKITISVILCSFIGILLNYILGIGSISILVLKLLLYTLIYLIIMWITSFNKDEKMLIFKLKNKLL